MRGSTVADLVLLMHGGFYIIYKNLNIINQILTALAVKRALTHINTFLDVLIG